MTVSSFQDGNFYNVTDPGIYFYMKFLGSIGLNLLAWNNIYKWASKRAKLCVNNSKNCYHLFSDPYVSDLMLGICTYINLFNSHKNHRGKTISPCFQIEGSATQKFYLTGGWRIKLSNSDLTSFIASIKGYIDILILK